MIAKVRIVEDTNQKIEKHTDVNNYFKSQGIEVIRQRLPVGDYILANEKVEDVFARKEARGIPVKMMDLVGCYDKCVDTKFSIQELVGDICGKSHDRFRDSLVFAMNNGIKMFIVVENDAEVIYDKNGLYVANKTITDLKDLHMWVNPRLWIFQKGKQKYPRATRGSSLMRACYTMQAKYNCEFLFTSSKDVGQKVIELLTQ